MPQEHHILDSSFRKGCHLSYFANIQSCNSKFWAVSLFSNFIEIEKYWPWQFPKMAKTDAHCIHTCGNSGIQISVFSWIYCPWSCVDYLQSKKKAIHKGFLVYDMRPWGCVALGIRGGGGGGGGHSNYFLMGGGGVCLTKPWNGGLKSWLQAQNIGSLELQKPWNGSLGGLRSGLKPQNTWTLELPKTYGNPQMGVQGADYRL